MKIQLQEEQSHSYEQQSTYDTKNILSLLSVSQLSISQWGRFILQLLGRKQTYLQLLYLVVSVPLGLAVCGFLLAGILGSIPLLLFGIGFPLLYVMILIWWGLAILERVLARSWLQVDIPPLPPSLLDIAQGRIWTRLRLHLSQGITWKTLAYLLAKGPFSLCVGTLFVAGGLFSLCAGLLLVGLGLMAFPLLIVWGAIAVLRRQGESVFRLYRRLFRAGVAVVFAPLGLLYGVAEFWGYFTRNMLSIDERERELLQAHERIKHEHERAERAEQQRRELVANLSHDLRTPVANIRGHAEALLNLAKDTNSDTAHSEQQLAYVSIIHREAVRLGTLFDELLALAREETNELHLSMQAVDLNTIIEDVYQTVRPLAYRERQITVSRTVQPGLPAVRADHQRLQQVLLNLVRNAIAYTPQGGLVAITLQVADKQHLVLAVADTGMGIAADEQARIFERFYRADTSRNRSADGLPNQSSGSGLGLTIVRELVEAMGGTVSVESAPGEGSCFSIILPIA